MSAEERREQLLDVVKSIVAERGFHAVSIEAVAREAGITRPVVYGHFRDLNGLLEALVEREGQRALAQLAAILPTDLTAGDPRAMLLAGMRGYLEAVQADPVTWRLVLMPPEGAPMVLRERIEQGRAAVVATLAGTVGPALGPERGSPDPELTARMMSALSDEGARLVLTDPERFPPERILRHTSWFLELLPVDPPA
jgi:AcrR family transcriptional regulator